VNRGVIEDGSYIPQQILALVPMVEKLLSDAGKAEDDAISLLMLKGVDVKSVAALLLHAYGETESGTTRGF